MMRALWAGVTGLQAHQIAMDVEGDNIANVNTIGFKYSRASFADLFSQTAKVATAPQGDLGGKNAMQIGLGTQINTTTRLFKQGSIQTTDKNTDLALQGDGFFVVSPDGGRTNYYTRNGDFTRDSLGNFVDNNGYIVQGWLRDEATGAIDATGPIKSIYIEPGMATPAKATSTIAVVGTLNSGSNIGTKSSPIYQLDSNSGWLDKNGNGIREDGEDKDENNINKNVYYVDKDKQVKVQEVGVDLGVLFNASGNAFNLREGQGMWVSYADAKATFPQLNLNQPGGAATGVLHIRLNGIEIPTTTVTNMQDVAAAINTFTTKTGVQASIINGNELQLTNTNNTGTTDAFKNIKIDKLDGDNTSITTTRVITAYRYAYSPVASGDSNKYDDSTARIVHTTEDLRKAIQTDARDYVNYSSHTGYTGVSVNRVLAANTKQGILGAITAMTGLPQATANLLNEIYKAADAAADDAAAVTAAKAIVQDTSGNPTEAMLIAMAGEWDSLLGYAVGGADQINFDAATIPTPTADINGNALHSNSTLKETNKNDGVQVIVNEKGQFSITNPAGDAAITEGDGYYMNAAIQVDAAASGIPANGTLPKGTKIPVDANNNQIPAGALYRVIYADGTTSDPARANAGDTAQNGPGQTQTAAYIEILETVIVDPADYATIPAGTWVPDTNDGRTTDQANPANPPVPFHLPINGDTFINDYNMQLAVTAMSDPTQNVNVNTAFAETFGALGGGLSSGNTVRNTTALVMSSHATTTEIYDSLGSKHTIKFEFRKISYSPENGTEWSVLVQVPEPGVINTETGEQANVISGTVRFGPNGGLIGYTPNNLTYTANNGSAPGQPIEINFGTIGESNGLRSNDNPSTTDNITQDGYAAGTLNELRVDETGTIIGAFTNGRSFGLAQVAVAKFTNNQGLESNGGNLFMRTANSGDPVIGAAQTAGRGKISASSLEMSNVDLSRSLTQLIVVQRGYQANSKTISTGDQMLTTLMQIKQ